MIDIFEVVGWLNATDASSHLTDEAKRFSRSARVVSRSDASVRRILDSLRDVGQLSPDPLETAEISLHRAAIEYWRGWFSQTARHARDAVIAYENDDHRRAVALWMRGMAQWEILRNHKAYTNCDRARTIFQERRVFFRHSPNERDWYKNRVRQMEIELAARPEEILTWLNWFEATNLTPPSQQLVDTAQEKIRQQAYPTVYALMQDLQEVNKWSQEVYERAEVFFECGLAAYQMGNTTFAIELLKKAVVDFSPGIGNNHKQVVARCMLGAVEWMDKSKHNQATVDWVRCIDDFEQLRLRADKDNNQKKKKWYADHRAILQAALSERLPGGRTKHRFHPSPKGKPGHQNSNPPKGNGQAVQPPNGKKPDQYETLVNLVHEQAIADRLIEFERTKAPNADRNELIERAIARVLRQRQ